MLTLLCRNPVLGLLPLAAVAMQTILDRSSARDRPLVYASRGTTSSSNCSWVPSSAADDMVVGSLPGRVRVFQAVYALEQVHEDYLQTPLSNSEIPRVVDIVRFFPILDAQTELFIHITISMRPPGSTLSFILNWFDHMEIRMIIKARQRLPLLVFEAVRHDCMRIAQERNAEDHVANIGG